MLDCLLYALRYQSDWTEAARSGFAGDPMALVGSAPRMPCVRLNEPRVSFSRTSLFLTEYHGL